LQQVPEQGIELFFGAKVKGKRTDNAGILLALQGAFDYIFERKPQAGAGCVFSYKSKVKGSHPMV
jgi:hypothetical protein